MSNCLTAAEKAHLAAALVFTYRTGGGSPNYNTAREISKKLDLPEPFSADGLSKVIEFEQIIEAELAESKA